MGCLPVQPQPSESGVPGGWGIVGGREMTPAREAELLRHIQTIASLDEARGFREQLRDQGEQLTSGVYAALLRRIDVMRQREGK